jgi:hypothetical protein
MMPVPGLAGFASPVVAAWVVVFDGGWPSLPDDEHPATAVEMSSAARQTAGFFMDLLPVSL